MAVQEVHLETPMKTHVAMLNEIQRLRDVLVGCRDLEVTDLSAVPDEMLRAATNHLCEIREVAGDISEAIAFQVASNELSTTTDTAAGRKIPGFLSLKQKDHVMGNQPSLATRNELPESMRNWKKDIGKGAGAAIEVYESLDGVLHGDGKLAHSLYGLTRDELLAVDPRVLEDFLADLRDLRERAEYAVEAMEAVMAAVQGGE